MQSTRLLPDSDVRYEAYEVFHWERPELITTCGQVFFSPVYEDPTGVIREAVDKALFPYTYRSWSREERVGHWGRRQAGESDVDEDEAFDADPALSYRSTAATTGWRITTPTRGGDGTPFGFSGPCADCYYRTPEGDRYGIDPMEHTHTGSRSGRRHFRYTTVPC